MMDPLGYRALLRLPGVAAVLLAMTLSRLASRMLALAIVLYALSRFDSPVLAGWLSFASVAPGLIIGPLAGALLDRVGPVRGMAADMAAGTCLILLLVAADALGWATFGLVMVLVLLLSLTSQLSAVGV